MHGKMQDLVLAGHTRAFQSVCMNLCYLQRRSAINYQDDSFRAALLAPQTCRVLELESQSKSSHEYVTHKTPLTMKDSDRIRSICQQSALPAIPKPSTVSILPARLVDIPLETDEAI